MRGMMCAVALIAVLSSCRSAPEKDSLFGGSIPLYQAEHDYAVVSLDKPVKEIRVETAPDRSPFFRSGRERIPVMVISFNRDGTLHEESDFDPNGKVRSRMRCQYRFGKKINVIRSGPGNTVLSTILYTYDGDGGLIGETLSDAGGTAVMRKNYFRNPVPEYVNCEYTDHGMMYFRCIVENMSGARERSYRVYELYDGKNRTVERFICRDGLIFDDFWEYDEGGSVMKMSRTRGNPAPDTEMFVYHKNGSLKERWRYIGYKDWVAVEFHDRIQKVEYRYEEYDGSGNWIRRKNYTYSFGKVSDRDRIDSYKKMESAGVTCRTITYFEN